MSPANPDLGLLLTTDLYFKGQWESPFDSTKTRLAPFLRAGGDSIHVPTMVRSAAFGHFEYNGERGLRIPYRGGRYAAYVLVPKSLSVADVVERLSVADVDGWNSRIRVLATILFLPRVEHRNIWPLRTSLAQAGVPRFVSERAQLGALWATQQEGTIIDDANQGTFLKIDEEGTEAAVGSAVVTSVQPPPVEFRVDAPFVFIIRDEVTGALMFVARVGDPADHGR